MHLLNSTRVRGSVIQFNFAHKSRKLGKITISTTAINEENAHKKAMVELKAKYKENKEWRKQYNAKKAVLTASL